MNAKKKKNGELTYMGKLLFENAAFINCKPQNEAAAVAVYGGLAIATCILLKNISLKSNAKLKARIEKDLKDYAYENNLSKYNFSDFKKIKENDFFELVDMDEESRAKIRSRSNIIYVVYCGDKLAAYFIISGNTYGYRNVLEKGNKALDTYLKALFEFDQGYAGKNILSICKSDKDAKALKKRSRILNGGNEKYASISYEEYEKNCEKAYTDIVNALKKMLDSNTMNIEIVDGMIDSEDYDKDIKHVEIEGKSSKLTYDDYDSISFAFDQAAKDIGFEHVDDGYAYDNKKYPYVTLMCNFTGGYFDKNDNGYVYIVAGSRYKIKDDPLNED